MERKVLLVSQVRVLGKVDSRRSKVLITVAAIIFDNVRVPASAVRRVVHIFEWLDEFGVHWRRIFYSLDVVVEWIAAFDAFAEGLGLETAIAHDNVCVAACAVTSVCCELLVVSPITREHCRSVHFCCAVKLLK